MEERAGVEVRRRDDGKMGVFATESFHRYQDVLWLKGEYQDRSKLTIEVSIDSHILDKIGRFVNHSFRPTVEVAGVCLIAVRDIAPGDEITFNYNESEGEIAAPFEDEETGKPVGDMLTDNSSR
jgi:hypothetical protein